jgi:hypothetical protein
MKLFAALREDTQQGWVWLQDSSLSARHIVKIKNPANGKVVYCEALQIDKNFLDAYNQSPRINIDKPQSALVINDWYRTMLGGLLTQSEVSLSVKPASNWWGQFRACIGHPQIIVRVSVWLGSIGLLLGVIGLVLGILSLWPKS